MSFQTNSDNIYQVGSIISAKSAPGVKLMIRKYYQRIYYCAVQGDETAKEQVFFERQLIAPS